MAVAAVLRPSSQSSRQASLLGVVRPKSACRSTRPEASAIAARLSTRPNVERRGSTPARRLPNEASRQFPRTAVPSSITRPIGTQSSMGSTLPPGRNVSSAARRTATPGLHVPGSTTGSFTKATEPTRGSSLSGGSMDRSAGRQKLVERRRRSSTTICAGMMVASSPTLGNCSSASSSPRSSKGACSETCPETVEEAQTVMDSVRRLEIDKDSGKATSRARENVHSRVDTIGAQQVQVPLGVEEDFAPYSWLSDAGIAFACSCLASSGSSILSRRSKRFPKSVLFMDPAMSFWLTMQDDAKYIEEAMSEMKLHELDLMLCPINDTHMTCTADAGSHWSLLACWGNAHKSSRQKGPFSNFRYYDSLGGLFAEKGLSQAGELANRLVGEAVQIDMGSCAQQTNFYDCGVYVLLYSEIIAAIFLEEQRREKLGTAISSIAWEDRLVSVTPEEVDACRAHYHSLTGDRSMH